MEGRNGFYGRHGFFSRSGVWKELYIISILPDKFETNQHTFREQSILQTQI